MRDVRNDTWRMDWDNDDPKWLDDVDQAWQDTPIDEDIRLLGWRVKFCQPVTVRIGVRTKGSWFLRFDDAISYAKKYERHVISITREYA